MAEADLCARWRRVHLADLGDAVSCIQFFLPDELRDGGPPDVCQTVFWFGTCPRCRIGGEECEPHEDHDVPTWWSFLVDYLEEIDAIPAADALQAEPTENPLSRLSDGSDLGDYIRDLEVWDLAATFDGEAK